MKGWVDLSTVSEQLAQNCYATISQVPTVQSSRPTDQVSVNDLSRVAKWRRNCRGIYALYSMLSRVKYLLRSICHDDMVSIFRKKYVFNWHLKCFHSTTHRRQKRAKWYTTETYAWVRDWRRGGTPSVLLVCLNYLFVLLCTQPSSAL